MAYVFIKCSCKKVIFMAIYNLAFTKLFNRYPVSLSTYSNRDQHKKYSVDQHEKHGI